MHDNGCPTSAFFFFRFPAVPPTSPAPTVPVTQCQMGSESSADPPLCGGNPQSFSSGLQVTEAVIKNSELILTSLLKVKRASHYPPCFSVNTKAAVAKRRNASLLCSCWKLFGLYCGDSELRRNTWKNRRERGQTVELPRVPENDFKVEEQVGSKRPPSTWNEIRKCFVSSSSVASLNKCLRLFYIYMLLLLFSRNKWIWKNFFKKKTLQKKILRYQKVNYQL